MITLFLMTSKGLRVIREIAQRNFLSHIDLVVIGTDTHVQSDFSNEITQFCQQQNVKYVHRREATEISSPFAFAVSWQWMIDLPKTKIITLHDSILPRYRGFSPLVTQLIKGDNEIGATALLASSHYDRGPIVAQKKILIHYPIKIADAIQLMEELYASLVTDIIGILLSGKDLPQQVQDDACATYSVWRDSDDYRIDWSQDATSIKRFIDAVGNPYLGATTLLHNKLVRISDAEVVPDVVVELRDAGKVLFVEQGNPIVICGTGLLRIVAAHDESGQSILPLTKFRSRFK